MYILDDRQFSYGAVYFRKSGPPRRDWERDYAQAAADGYNTFRHWFIWSAIETAPGIYDWEDYDRQLELAEKYGLKTVVAEITTAVPQWLLAERPDLLPCTESGGTARPEMGVSCGTGGFFTGLCLDHPEAKEYVQRFLQTLAARYKGHPALLGYDVANECYKPSGICYCEATIKSYREWLKNKYGSIEMLNQAWKTYSYTDFSQILPPPKPAFFADSVCWLEFRREKHLEQIQWKIDTLRSVDTHALITAHGMSATFTSYSDTCCDDWAAADKVQTYGTTWVQCRKGNEPWKQMTAMDLTRAASRGRPFWHAEAQGGPLWFQPGLEGRSRRDGRIPDEADIRIWNLMTMACGAKGLFYTRFRPLLDGPLFAAFAPYQENGAATARSKMASRLAHWACAPQQKELMQAKPASGEIAILFVPESETASYLLKCDDAPHWYSQAMWGAWRGFQAAGIQADYIHIDDIDEIKLLYVPYPVSLTRKHQEQLCRWVERGGRLISEGCPGYFDGMMHTDPEGAGRLLDRLFGVRQTAAEFAPNLAKKTKIELWGETVFCGGYVQTYAPDNGIAEGWLEKREAAASKNYGKGRALLIGTSLGIGCMAHGPNGFAALFKKLFAYIGGRARLELSDSEVIARVQQNGAERYLWLLNPSHERKEVTLAFPEPIACGKILWAGGKLLFSGKRQIVAMLESCDGLVFQLFTKDSAVESVSQ